ncbi:MAG TPA: exodeoxyribonuclease VII large subunit, partial [Bryobacteraceae bacterium]|nr:exodeoxyribonuclease VII large subunit [Bryobacteraceae bacterium]
QRRIYTLRELSDGIRASLEARFTNIWVSGEISSCKMAPSGHCYFTLKDADAQIKCVCWRLSWMRLKFKPKDGIEVLVRGRIDIYEQRSEYQFVVEVIEPRGHGALQLAFEQLRDRLRAEGLFEEARKRPLPRFPRRIGIVTSPKGAVIRDFIEVLSKRFPGLHVRLFPAQVQGVTAVEEVCRGLSFFGAGGWAQVIVLARGGGSLEDLWTFNEEAVARAIAASPIPVVSAIGHETDVTIADFVADLRAPTPSAAAAMIICEQRELVDRIASREARLAELMRYRFAMLHRRLRDQTVDHAASTLHRAIARRMQRVDENTSRISAAARTRLAAHERRRRQLEERLRFFDLRPRVARSRERLNLLTHRAESLARERILQPRRRLETAETKLGQLNPRLVLARGYAIVLDDAGAIVRNALGARAGDTVKLMFAEDAVKARVTESPSE